MGRPDGDGPRKALVERLACLVDGLVVPSKDARPIDLLRKIDIISRALDLLRQKKRYLDNRLPLGEFLASGIDASEDELVYPSPEHSIPARDWTRPVRFQSPLLVLLLVHHERRHRVYRLIETLVHELWDSLDPLDFERTKTGVVRCFTNIRFAALALRDYGLLRYTPKEAYRTWVLSLPGFAVGSELLHSSDKPLSLGSLVDVMPRELHPDIRAALGCLSDYETFVAALARICQPNVILFERFGPTLEAAYALLDEYRAVLQDHDLSYREELQRTRSCIERLAGLPHIEDFYKELSISILLELPADTCGQDQPPPPLGTP